MDVSAADRDMMIRTVIGEAADQSPVGQAAVAHTIMNRVRDGSWGDNPSDVVLSRGQFEPWGRRAGELMGISQRSPQYRQVGKIVDSVLSGEAPDPTGGATHFLDPAIVRRRRGGDLPDWAQGNGLAIGDHTFFAPANPNYGRGGVAAINAALKDNTGLPDSALGFESVSDDDRKKFLDRYGISEKPAGAPAPASEPILLPKDTVDDFMTRYGLSSAAPKPAMPAEMVPATAPPTPREEYLAAQRGIPSQFISSVPVAGAAFDVLTAGLTAIKQRPGEDTKSYVDRFWQRAEEQHRADALVAAQNPLTALAANTAGGLSLAPLGATALGGRILGTVGSTLGARVYGGTAGGAGINALDAALRGENPVPAATLGAAGGFVGPIFGEGVRSGGSALATNLGPRPGPLAGVNRTGIDWLTRALEGETRGSLAAARERAGPSGFVGDLNTALTDLTGGIADTPGGGKATVREAYRARAAGQADRIEGHLDRTMGPNSNILDYQRFLTESRAAAADPLYEQWRTSQVHPTPEIKALMPRLEAAGAFDMAQELSGISGRPIDRNFFTPGPQKAYPTTEAWDYVKRGLDRRIDQAYAGGDNTLARELVGLRNNLVDEIEKTPAGQVWRQARQEFASRSSLIDQIACGRDTFLGGRSGMSVDELREELAGLSGPELAARIQGMRSAASEAMGDSLRGDTTLRNKLLARNNQAKIRLMIGDDRADDLIRSLEQERFLGNEGQTGNVLGGSQTTPKEQRVNALQPAPLPGWNPSLTEPLSWIPPHLREMLRPSTVLEGSRGQRYEAAREALAPVLTRQLGPGADAVLSALADEAVRRGTIARISGRVGSALTAGTTAVLPYDVRRYYEQRPALRAE